MLEIKVGQGSCGISAGAGKVYDALQSALAEQKIDANLSVTGCIGMCFLEPIVDVYADGSLTRLVRVTPKDVPAIADFLRTGDASAVASLLYDFVLKPFGLDYMKTIVFILVIAALVQIVEMFLKKTSPAVYRALGIYLPLITTNCAVLGVTVNNIENSFNFTESLCNSFGAGMGLPNIKKYTDE